MKRRIGIGELRRRIADFVRATSPEMDEVEQSILVNQLIEIIMDAHVAVSRKMDVQWVVDRAVERAFIEADRAERVGRA